MEFTKIVGDYTTWGRKPVIFNNRQYFKTGYIATPKTSVEVMVECSELITPAVTTPKWVFGSRTALRVNMFSVVWTFNISEGVGFQSQSDVVRTRDVLPHITANERMQIKFGYGENSINGESMGEVPPLINSSGLEIFVGNINEGGKYKPGYGWIGPIWYLIIREDGLIKHHYVRDEVGGEVVFRDLVTWEIKRSELDPFI